MRRVFLVLLVLGLIAVVVGVALAVLPPGGTFVDDDGNIHEPMIEAIAAEGLTNGCDVDPPRYCPTDEVNRAELATFVVRAMGEEGNMPVYQGYFADVPVGKWYTPFVERAYELGITKGCSTDPLLFCPFDTVLRSEMAAFLVRMKEGDTNLPVYQAYFADVLAGKWYTGYAERLYELGVTNGCALSPLRYCPQDPVLRDQMASFLGRSLNLTPITPPPTTSSTTTSTTLPTTDHPQSGDGWTFIGCSDPTGTCTYLQTASTPKIKLAYPPLPPRTCIRWGIGCEQWAEQWNLSWYNPTGSLVSSSCTAYYSIDTGLIAGWNCYVPIAGKPLGEYRGELCYKPYPSSTCTEDLLTVYFNVTG